RTTGTGAGNFAIVGPTWQGQLPAGVQEIKAPTNMVWILGRTQTNGVADFPAVNAIQQQFKLAPLSVFNGGAAPQATAAAPQSGDTQTAPVAQVAAMDAATFFSRFAALLSDNPPAADDAPMVEKISLLGIVPGKEFLLDK